MSWILDHLQILIAVGAALAYWLNQRKEAQTGDDASGDSRGDFAPSTPADPDEAARTRRIQEEIRRKIAERAGGGPIAVPPSAPEPPPIFQRDTMAPRPVASPLPMREVRREPEPEPSAVEAAAMLERQKEMEAQLRVLAEARREAQRKTAAAAAFRANETGTTPVRGDLLTDLRGARNLRRAIVLREVLGPPVALR